MSTRKLLRVPSSPPLTLAGRGPRASGSGRRHPDVSWHRDHREIQYDAGLHRLHSTLASGLLWPLGHRNYPTPLRRAALPLTAPKLRHHAAAARRAHGPTTLRTTPYLRPARVGGRGRRAWARCDVRLVEGAPEQQERQPLDHVADGVGSNLCRKQSCSAFGQLALQSQITPQAAPGSGQPRPIQPLGRLWLARRALFST